MAFETGYLANPKGTGPGQQFGNSNNTLTFTNYGTLPGEVPRVGRFAYQEQGLLYSYPDLAPDGTIQGVVLLPKGYPVTFSPDDDEITSEKFAPAGLPAFVTTIVSGLVTVRVDPASPPIFPGNFVYIVNTPGATIGMATVDPNGEVNVPTYSYFMEDMGDNVWLILLRG